ncbi:hypothetical protein OS493_026527 [Desmophyllum pertusum]|uniref:Uncharacterized protein n=1 Tax=Desmophyllum pertusum TaxID=174260 RepID=A0A9W9YL29_9CNID|nr:hypothetical protein OS493_026527 [Desmophyllum pertusum]
MKSMKINGLKPVSQHMLPVQFNSSYIQPQKLLKLSQWKVTVKVTIAKATPRKPRNQERQRKTKIYVGPYQTDPRRNRRRNQQPVEEASGRCQ